MALTHQNGSYIHVHVFTPREINKCLIISCSMLIFGMMGLGTKLE